MYWFVIALATIPIPLLIFSWYRTLARPPLLQQRMPLILLLAATFSNSWVLLAWKYPGALGNDYSNLRYSIISFNAFAMLACAVLASLSNSRSRIPLAFASTLLAALWFIVGAINSSV
jgi:hypothetical protein